MKKNVKEGGRQMRTRDGETSKFTLQELVFWYAGIRVQLHVERWLVADKRWEREGVGIRDWFSYMCVMPWLCDLRVVRLSGRGK